MNSKSERRRKESQAITIDMEATIRNRNSTALDMPEAATKKTDIIPILPDDVILYIFHFLDTQDRIALAFSCERFRSVSMFEGVFRKTDLSRHTVSTTQRKVMNEFIRDRELTQHIRELNLSNLRVLNWQMDEQLEEFISICPHLEALHVLDCGMGLQRLCQIVKQAPKLTSLSWSVWDFTSDDIQFLVNSMESDEEICLKNIKHLHLEILRSPHIQIAKYLLLSCFRDLEELEIYIWWIDMQYCTGWNLLLQLEDSIPGFSESSDGKKLQHLHSLMVVAVGDPPSADYYDSYGQMLTDLVISVLRRKASSTKWKKFWISPPTCITKRFPYDFSFLLHEDDFQSVEGITADLSRSGEMPTFFQRMGDNTLRRLHLCLPIYDCDKFCDPISRVGGHSLKFLSLSLSRLNGIYPEQNMSLHSLFSACMNITELDLLKYIYGEDICELLSKLKHLTKVQLTQCAIGSRYSCDNQLEISKANLLTIVENCKNITHLDIRGCGNCNRNVYCHLTNDDLLPLAKLRNLKSLTLYKITGIKDWNFLKKIVENCKFLTMLRIRLDRYGYNDSHIPILMESVKFLQHFALDMRELDNIGFQIEYDFWNLLSRAKNLQRLCIRNSGMHNISHAVQMLKSLPQLHVVHLHSDNIENGRVFRNKMKGQMKRMWKKKESDSRFSFEIVTGNRRRTWIKHQTGCSLIYSEALPLNEAELCNMLPILDIPRY